MGSALRRQLREVLPASIKGLPRAVALEIADDARYDDGGRYSPEMGRRSRASLTDLARWTASKNERVIGDALRTLALAGWEFRVPFGKGKDGRPLYAVPGRAVEFRVPDFEAPAPVDPGPTEGPVTTGPSSEGPATTGASTPEGPVTTAEGPVVTAEGPATAGPGPVTTGPPSPIPSSSHRDPTSSSPPGPETAPAVVADATEGGGGGSDLRSMARHIAASLDYRGQTPDRRQRKTIEDRLVAALEGGWTLEGLAVYLHLGNYRPDSVAAFYMAKLHPDRLPPAAPLPAPARAAGGIRGHLPDAAAIEGLTLDDVFGPARRDTADGGLWERAAARARARMAGAGARGGTDDRVAGWGQVARDLAAREPHRPYSDDPWHAPADPVEATAIPWCGELECDPVMRLRDVEIDGGLKVSAPCEKCHPKRPGQHI